MSQTRYIHQDPQGLPPLIQQNRFAVLDIETTGLSRHKDEVIQVAVAQVDYGRPRFRGVVHVRPTRTIHPEALAVHGISFEVLQHAFPFETLAPDILTLIGERTLLGYGSSTLDIPILQRQFAEQAGRRFDPPSLDVLSWTRKLLPKTEKKNLKSAATFLEVPLLEGHDAFDDIRMTWNVFITLAARHETLGQAVLDDTLSTRPVPELQGVIL